MSIRITPSIVMNQHRQASAKAVQQHSPLFCGTTSTPGNQRPDLNFGGWDAEFADILDQFPKGVSVNIESRVYGEHPDAGGPSAVQCATIQSGDKTWTVEWYTDEARPSLLDRAPKLRDKLGVVTNEVAFKRAVLECAQQIQGSDENEHHIYIPEYRGGALPGQGADPWDNAG